MTGPATATVLIVDDHAIVRFGLAEMLGRDPAFAVVGEATAAAEALRQAAALRPDLAIVDLMLGGRDGLDLVRALVRAAPGLAVLVYSAQPEHVYAARAFQAGAQGYLMKDAGIEAVPEALAAMLAGERYASPAVQRAMFQAAAAGRAPAAEPLGALSDRELQVLGLLGAGLGTAEIAAALALSMKTIGTYRERLKLKIGADNAFELERRATEFVRTGRL